MLGFITGLASQAWLVCLHAPCRIRLTRICCVWHATSRETIGVADNITLHVSIDQLSRWRVVAITVVIGRVRVVMLSGAVACVIDVGASTQTQVMIVGVNLAVFGQFLGKIINTEVREKETHPGGGLTCIGLLGLDHKK